MPYGWQTGGDISSVVQAVDFFMINNFPYFSPSAKTGGDPQSWKDFTSGIDYMAGIANGKPLLVTQVGVVILLQECGDISHYWKHRLAGQAVRLNSDLNQPTLRFPPKRRTTNFWTVTALTILSRRT